MDTLEILLTPFTVVGLIPPIVNSAPDKVGIEDGKFGEPDKVFCFPFK